MSTTEESLDAGTVGEPTVAESDRREVSGGAHFAALDGYRAIAALMVVLTHVATSSGVAITGGVVGHVLARFDFGVPLFFLMSGFLLYRPWVRTGLEGRARPGLGRYALRRAARILPLYWVVVVVTLAVLPEIQPVSPQQWVTHLAGLQIYTSTGVLEGLSQTWSLCTEISFYVVLPLVGLLATVRPSSSPERRWRRQLVVLGLLVAVSLVYNVVLRFTDALPYQAGFWLPAYLDWFAAGMLLALVEVRSRQGSPTRLVRLVMTLGRDQATCLILFASLFVIALTPVAGSYDFNPTAPWESLIKHWLYLGAAFFLLLPGIVEPAEPRGWAKALTAPVPHALGLISYGIFLWHLVLLRLLAHWLDIPYFSGQFWLLAAGTLGMTLPIAWVTYLLVERPAQRWAHRR
ncbi:MAG: acyltransferase [Candidatus Nanopelagicales bacterium]